MRIITGSARGTNLATLEGEDITRPTTGKVKEAIFSAIQFDIEGRRVLDLFAGCGQMGLEALSRGAQSCVFVDSSDKAIAIVKQNAQKTKLYAQSVIMCGGYKEYIKGSVGKREFDIVFIDPPYGKGLGADALKRLGDSGLLAKGAIVVCEDEKELTDFDESVFEHKNTYNYGRVVVTMFIARGKDDE